MGGWWDGDWGVKMATDIKYPRSLDTKPVGRGYGFEFVLVGKDAGTTLNPMNIF